MPLTTPRPAAVTGAGRRRRRRWQFLLVAEAMTAAGGTGSSPRKVTAGDSGFTVLCGQCAEIGDSVPYLPFADALRTAPPHVEQVIKARPVLARGSAPGRR